MDEVKIFLSLKHNLLQQFPYPLPNSWVPLRHIITSSPPPNHRSLGDGATAPDPPRAARPPEALGPLPGRRSAASLLGTSLRCCSSRSHRRRRCPTTSYSRWPATCSARASLVAERPRRIHCACCQRATCIRRSGVHHCSRRPPRPWTEHGMNCSSIT
jgi:hypothetical protein